MKAGTHCSNCCLTVRSCLGQCLTPSQPGSAPQPGIFSSVGVPHKLQIFSSWFRSELPQNIGLRSHISPITHPTPHMSIANP
jgi:hypothetical protein